MQYVLQDSLLASAFETAAPIVIECKGPDMTTLRKIADDILREVAAVPGVFGAKTSLALPSSETRVEMTNCERPPTTSTRPTSPGRL